jgi:hypothetical protein
MRHKVHQAIGLEFLFTEIEAALLFAGIALDAAPQETEKIERNRRHAQEAYSTVIRYKPLVDFDASRQKEFDARLQQVASVLRQLAERTPPPGSVR